jgi:hypothetical protein
MARAGWLMSNPTSSCSPHAMWRAGHLAALTPTCATGGRALRPALRFCDGCGTPRQAG